MTTPVTSPVPNNANDELIQTLMARIQELEAQKAKAPAEKPVEVEHYEFKGHNMLRLKGGDIHWKGINLSVKKARQVVANIALIQEALKQYD